MLQPAESPLVVHTHSSPESAEGGLQQPNYFTGPSTDESTPPALLSVHNDHHAPLETRPDKPTFWKWITTRELVFIFLACSIGAALFRTSDIVFIDLSWKEVIDVTLYRNGKFPMSPEKLPPPIVTDLDSDGVTDMLILTYDHKLELFSFPPEKPYHQSKERTQQTITDKAMADVWELSDGGKPVTMAAGYLHPYQSMLQVRRQVVAVLTDDWTVLCLDHELKLLWKTRVSDKDRQEFSEFSIYEAAMLVSPVSIHKGDLGVVIVGGREMSRQRAPEESLKRIRRGSLPDNEKELLDSLGHYSMFALEGRSGEQRWKLSPDDYEISPAYPPVSSFHHLKLIMHKKLNRDGEVSWHQFSSALRGSLPHSWMGAQDTHFSLAHFKKDRKKSENSPVTDHISKVGDLAVEHIGGLAFGGQPPHSPSEHVQGPNVLILHSVKGLDVVHVYLGRPLCSMRLSPYHSAHADIDGDGTIDHVHAVVNPGEAGFSEDDDEEDGNSPDCYGMATPMASSHNKHLFKHSICKATHWSETFIATDKWLPVLNKSGRKRVDHDITEPLAPVLIESPYHSAPLKLHMGGGGWDVKGIVENTVGAPTPRDIPSLSEPSTHHQGPMYDSVFVLSSGRITSVGPQGEFNWQVDTMSDWDTASEVIYNPQHPTWKKNPNQVMFVHGGFTPSATPISLQAYGKKDHILVVGWNMMEILSAEDGHSVSVTKLTCQSVSPPVVADFSGDGWNDIIITCANGYAGFTMDRQSGFLQTTILSLFVGVVIVVIAIYTRQRTIGLFPVIKAAQD